MLRVRHYPRGPDHWLRALSAVTQRWPLGFPLGSSMSVELKRSYKVVANHGVKVGVYVPGTNVVDLSFPQKIPSSLSL